MDWMTPVSPGGTGNNIAILPMGLGNEPGVGIPGRARGGFSRRHWETEFTAAITLSNSPVILTKHQCFKKCPYKR